MKTVSIDGYLDQTKLEAALRQLVGESAWRGRKVRVEPRRFKWDMVFERGGARVAVEYDGDEHDRHSLKLKADREKDDLARASGITVVRFPYWVQLTTETGRRPPQASCSPVSSVHVRRNRSRRRSRHRAAADSRR